MSYEVYTPSGAKLLAVNYISQTPGLFLTSAAQYDTEHLCVFFYDIFNLFFTSRARADMSKQSIVRSDIT